MMAGRDRKNSIKALFGGDIMPAAERAPETKSLPPSPDVPRAASGAVKAMGLTLSSITREAEEARALRQALEDSNRNDTDLQRRTVRVLERMDTLGMPPARVEA